MKSLDEMDLDEWELLPDDGFLEINDDGSGNKIYSRKYYSKDSTSSSIFKMNYFISPTPKSTPKFVENSSDLKYPNQIQPPIKIPNRIEEQVLPKIEIKIAPSETTIKSVVEDPTISQVFFKKMKETEFVDMKVESPKSNRGMIMPPPQIEGGSFQLETGKSDSEKELDMDEEEELLSDDEGVGLNVWKKLSLNGIGTVCSFGIAAVCIIVFSTHRGKIPLQKKNHKLQFQIYTNDKRVNQAISAVRGVPSSVINRAQITFGGYYDAAAAAAV